MTFRNPESESDFHFPSPELVNHCASTKIRVQSPFLGFFKIQEQSTAMVGAHSAGWGRVWGRGRGARRLRPCPDHPGPSVARFSRARGPRAPPRARLASLRCGGPLQPLGERPEGGGKR